MTKEKLPFVSVLVPVKNEEKHIASTIKSLKSQSYPKDKYEIIIVDNNSSDNTVLEIKKEGIDCNVSTTNRIGKLRNELAEMARGSILAYIDGDCVAPEEWISNAVSLLTKFHVGGAGGYIDGPCDANWIVTGWALRKRPRECETNILATGSFFIKRSVFEEVSGFAEHLVASEDTDISKRIIESGYKLLLSPKLSIIHYGYPSTLRGFIKREMWQTSDYWVSRKHGFDPIFIFTVIQASTIVIFSVCLILGKYYLALIMPAVFFMLVLSLSLYKLIISNEKNKVQKFPKVIGVITLYSLGRVLGLLNSTAKLCTLRYKK